MRYIGIHSGHDAGMAVINEGGDLAYYSLRERITRRKRDGSLGDINTQLTEAGLSPLDGNDYIFAPGVEQYGRALSDLAYAERLDKDELCFSLSDISSRYRFYYVSHHLSHACASVLFREDERVEDSLYLVFDGSGRKTNIQYGFYSIGRITDQKLVELENDKLNPNLYCTIQRLERLSLPQTNTLAKSGKLMGLAGYYPEAPAKSLSELNVPEIIERYDRMDSGRKNSGFDPKLDRTLMIDYASVYISFIADMKKLIKRYLESYPTQNVVVGGGTFLALDLNTFISNRGHRVTFSPAVNDSGVALGAAALGYFLMTKRWPKRLQSPFIQWGPKEVRSSGYINPKEAAQLLDRGEVIGLVTGQGEAGPRALGNRSILARPTVETAKHVSMVIKGREFFRPVAPIVTDGCFDQLFTGPKGRYMQYRNECTSTAQKLAPGIVHGDSSARAQVLDQSYNPWLYETLIEFGRLSGVECLINTSLNTKDKPICNTVTDAVNEFGRKAIRLVYF